MRSDEGVMKTGQGGEDLTSPVVDTTGSLHMHSQHALLGPVTKRWEGITLSVASVTTGTDMPNWPPRGPQIENKVK